MKKFYFQDKYDKPIVLALGFFDCVHQGHKLILEEAKRIAVKLGARAAALTFANDPNRMLGKKPQVYGINERETAFSDLGIEVMIYAYFNEEFSNVGAEEFLDILTQNFNIAGVVAGKDYTFGSGGLGNVSYLKEYMGAKNIKVRILPFEKLNSKKLSTTMIKKVISEGNIAMVNSCLTEPYFMLGTIIHANHRGTVLGYPTANLSLDEDNFRLRSGIYATKMIIDGKSYMGGTNVGEKPTFGETNFSVETYLFDFNRDIYGKHVKLVFYKKIRDVMKFHSIPALQKQLAKDIEEIKRYFETEKSWERGNNYASE